MNLKLIYKNLTPIFFVFHVLISINLGAQEKIVSYSDQYWLQYYGQLQFSPKWSLLGDGGIRMKKAFQEKAATLGRIGIQYKIGEQVTTALGGAYFSQYTNDKINREEWRSWQEILIKHNLNRFFTTHRFRLEERYFHSLSTGKDNFNFRMRYKFNVTFPLNHKSIQANTIYLVAADEIFINFGNEITYNFFDQNRLIGGAGYKINDNYSVSLSYVFQYAQKNIALTFEDMDVLWLTFSHTIKLKKKETNN